MGHESVPGLESFIKDAEAVTSNLKAAVTNLQKGDAASMILGLGELAAALEALQAAMGDAGASVEQLDALASVIAMFKDSSQIICHVGEELIVNGKNILSRIENATTHFAAREWQNFGFDIGVIIGEVLSPTAETSQPSCWLFNSCCQQVVH